METLRQTKKDVSRNTKKNNGKKYKERLRQTRKEQ